MYDRLMVGNGIKAKGKIESTVENDRSVVCVWSEETMKCSCTEEKVVEGEQRKEVIVEEFEREESAWVIVQGKFLSAVIV